MRTFADKFATEATTAYVRNEVPGMTCTQTLQVTRVYANWPEYLNCVAACRHLCKGGIDQILSQFNHLILISVSVKHELIIAFHRVGITWLIETW